MIIPLDDLKNIFKSMGMKKSMRSVWHWVAGGMIPFMFFIHPSAPWLAFTGFIIYQVKQDKDLAKSNKKNPDSHLDIYELVTPMTVGLAIMGILCFIARIL